MPKCDFNKVALQLHRNCASAWVLSCKFAASFQNTLSQEHLWVAIYTKIIQPNPDFSTEKYKFYLEINVKKGFESVFFEKTK